MPNKLTITSIAALTVTAVSLCEAPQTHAQQSKPAQAADSPKVAAIKKLLETMRTVQNAQMGMDLMMEQQVKGMNQSLIARIDQNASLSRGEKDEAIAKTTARLDRIMNRYKELVKQKVNIPEIAELSYVKLYDKYYNLDEIKAMQAYYQSPVGQKTLDTMPQLINEGVQTMSAQVSPKLRDVSAQMDEELKSGKLD